MVTDCGVQLIGRATFGQEDSSAIANFVKCRRGDGVHFCGVDMLPSDDGQLWRLPSTIPDPLDLVWLNTLEVEGRDLDPQGAS
jgi:hypothetical protein